MRASGASRHFRIWRWEHAILLSVLLVNIVVGTISPRVGLSMLMNGDTMMALLMMIYTDKLETGENVYDCERAEFFIFALKT